MSSRTVGSLPLPWALASLAFLVATVFGLTRAQYPGWRIGVVGVLVAGVILRNISPARVRDIAPRAWLAMDAALITVAVTGGLRSPFLIMVMGPIILIVAILGWRGVSIAAIVLVSVAALAMALVPRHWLGPDVSEPAHTALAALTLIAVVTIATAHGRAMSRALEASREEIVRARESLARDAFSRAREMEQLSAQLSHELKNPLGAIKTLVQLSAREATDAKSRERLQIAETQIERMNAILKEYLSFARPFAKLQRERVDVGALVEELLQLLAPDAARSGVALRRRGEALVDGDPRRLKEALINLVANAVEATPRGGTVEIEIGRRDNAVEVAVRDSGFGIPPDVLEKIGTPFFTTREHGTGLGVALARAAFVQHGGALQYTSAVGRGTTALGILPLPERDDGAPAAGG
jgi:signal transduction histidine kinase